MNGSTYKRSRGSRISGYIIAVALTALVVGVPVYVLGVSQGAKETEKADAVASTRQLKATVGSITERVDKLADRVDRLEQELSAQQDKGADGASTTSTTLSQTSESAIGYIKSVSGSGSNRSIRIDYVEFLNGRSAAKAMIADGKCSGTVAECMPDNDYYIRNLNKKIRAFPISDTATFYREIPGERDTTKKKITFSQFKALRSIGTDSNPFRIKVRDGQLSEATEVFLP